MPFDSLPQQPVYDLDNSCADRLRFLADFLEGVPEELAIMRWVTEWLECGTIHCAWGWAKTIPEFKRLGILEVGGVCHGPTEFFSLHSDEAFRCFMPSGYHFEPKRPDGEPFKRDIVRHLRETAEKVAQREMAHA